MCVYFSIFIYHTKYFSSYLFLSTIYSFCFVQFVCISKLQSETQLRELNILTCISKEGDINIITDSYKPKRISD